MTGLITAIAMLLVCSIIWAFGVYQDGKREEIWQALADEFGGEIVDAEVGWFSNDSSKALLLRFEGFPVRVDSFYVTRRSGNSNRRVYFQRARVMVEEGETAEIYEEMVSFSFLGALVERDVTVGDPDYDEVFVVRASSPRSVSYTHLRAHET